MKMLIAYDGSDWADAALDELSRAGLPEAGEALVLSVAEMTSRLANVAVLAAGPGYYFPDDPKIENLHDCQMDKARSFAALASDRLRACLPRWRITTETVVDSAQSAIVRKATDWKPDLIVTGSHGRSGFKRFVVGSVSQHVLNHTQCSVRIGRRLLGSKGLPIRLIIGMDGSPDGAAALQCVAARHWPRGTQVRVVGVVDPRSWVIASAAGEPGSICMPEIEEELRTRALRLTEQAARDLAKSGLVATPRVLGGNPGHALLAEAEQWDADCVFVGARGRNAMKRFFLGSVSTAVALRAHCSVEVVRNSSLCEGYRSEIFAGQALGQ